MDKTSFVIDKPNLEVRTSRVFAATPERLWQACTDSVQIPKWWGYSTQIETDEQRVGGKWRYVQRGEDGEFGFRGEYQVVDKPSRIVRTFEYEPIPGHGLVETMVLEPLEDGATRFTDTAKYANLEDLEGMVGMGMEHGQRDGMERLAALVETA